MSGLDLRLSEFGPAFGWLLQRDVSSTRLASIFRTTAVNVRVIAHRSRLSDREVDSVPTNDAESLGVRAGPSYFVCTPAGTRKLEALQDAMDRTVRQFSAGYQFDAGVNALRRLAPRIGYPGDARRIALSAHLHQHIAWFLVHSGRCQSATKEAGIARDLWRNAHRESGSREYIEGFVRSALIGSNANLLIRQPDQALRILELAKDGAESIGARRGSDHFRQRGVALFLLREDGLAMRQFEKATQAMVEMREARTPAQLLMTGARYTSLLGKVNWDQSQQVLMAARDAFGHESLETSMSLHWAAACGLSTGSPSIIQDTLECLQADPDPSAQLGHQSTIRKLLRITPELGLDERLLRAWVRRTLYENAFRNR